MESEESKTNRRQFGLTARRVTQVAIVVNFVGMAVLMLTLFPVAIHLLIWGLPIDDFFFNGYLIVGLSMAFTPMIKVFPGLMMPAIALAFLKAGRRQAAAGILLVSGALTIPPIIIGGPLLLEPLLAWYGILPLVPHVVGGALLVAAGVLALLWTGPPEPAPATFVSVTAQPALTIRTEPAVREVVLVVCPFCGTKNPQGTTKCSNCGGRI